jgi:DNA repair exonuclease SbcCD ATPase subunit
MRRLLAAMRLEWTGELGILSEKLATMQSTLENLSQKSACASTELAGQLDNLAQKLACARSELAGELDNLAQKVACTRSELAGELDNLAQEAVKVWISNELEAEMNKLRREVRKFEEMVRADWTSTSEIFAGHHLELAQQVADEVVRMNQKLDGLTQEADSTLALPGSCL